MRKPWHFFLFIAVAALSSTAVAQDSAAVVDPLFMPLVFDQWNETSDPASSFTVSPKYQLDAGDQWLRDDLNRRSRREATRFRTTVDHPGAVRYNAASLPELPPEHAIAADPAQGRLTVAPPPHPPVPAPPPEPEPKLHNWLHTFNASLHFTQAYISGNWYQGGENNLNILADVKWECNLNQTLHPNWLFNNTLQYKLGIATAHSDSLRNYMINEDNFQFSSQLGYKAVKHWYYSAMLQFKTQFFKNYKSNTNTMTAAFLSPAELNLGLGMTYELKDLDGDRTFTLAIAPLSYNLKICRDIDNLNPVDFGIDAGHHTKHSIGSNVEAKLSWKINAAISWTSRFYVFTDYSYVQGDWENTFDFTITKHLNTQIYTHLRYDKSRPRDDRWNYWQFKEILSFGLVYRFATE